MVNSRGWVVNRGDKLPSKFVRACCCCYLVPAHFSQTIPTSPPRLPNEPTCCLTSVYGSAAPHSSSTVPACPPLQPHTHSSNFSLHLTSHEVCSSNPLSSSSFISSILSPFPCSNTPVVPTSSTSLTFSSKLLPLRLLHAPSALRRCSQRIRPSQQPSSCTTLSSRSSYKELTPSQHTLLLHASSPKQAAPFQLHHTHNEQHNSKLPHVPAPNPQQCTNLLASKTPFSSAAPHVTNSSSCRPALSHSSPAHHTPTNSTRSSKPSLATAPMLSLSFTACPSRNISTPNAQLHTSNKQQLKLQPEQTTLPSNPHQ